MNNSTQKNPRPPTAGNVETLRRRLRQVEQNHKDWQEQAQKELSRQRMELETLRRDNDQYKQQLNEMRATEATTTSGSGSLRNPHSSGTRRSKELDAKRETLHHLEMKYQNNETQLRDMQRQIDDTRSQIRGARKGMGGVNVTKENHDLINRQVAVLENRLDQSLVRFNEVLRQNKELREQIDTLRGERDVFESIYQKLESELQEKKKEMAFIIEVSNIAYEERDNNQQVLKNLKNFAAEEMNSFAETFKELDDLLEEDRKMKEQVKTRISELEKKESNNAKDAGKKGKSSSQTGGGGQRGGGSPVTNEGQANKDGESLQSQAQAYEEAFMTIHKAAPEDVKDLKDLVDRFLKAEEENFSLFSYVNDLSKEIEALEKQRGGLLDEIDSISQGDEDDQKRRATLKSLEERLRSEESKNNKLIEMSLSTDGILRGVMTTVENIFNNLTCDETAIIEQHGVKGLTLENLLLYLASIELRTDEYLLAWSRQTGSGTEGLVGPRGPQQPFDTLQVTVDPKRLPGTSEDADGSDDDDHPLTREELIRKVQKKSIIQSLAADRKAVRGAGKGRVGIGLAPKK